MTKRLIIASSAVGVGILSLLLGNYFKNLKINASIETREIEKSKTLPNPSASNLREDIDRDSVYKNYVVEGGKIADIQRWLKDSQAIERLNTESTAPIERNNIAAQLKYLDRLRSQEIEKELHEIEKQLEFLELNHDARVREFGAK